MNAVIIVVVIIVILIIVALVARRVMNQRQTTDLRERFGPEYDRAVGQYGEGNAEPALKERVERVQTLNIVPLSFKDRERFSGEWQELQSRFVDDPAGAVGQADDLVGRVMQARGYPVGDFEQRAADVSVDHPEVVQNYRAAHDIALRQEAGDASTEDLRQAMVHFRSLFEELLSADESRAPNESDATA